MALINYIVFVLVCLLGAYSWVARKNADSAELLDKVRPYQGIIGIVALVLGLVSLIQTLSYAGYIFAHLYGVVAFVAVIIQIILGFLLAYPILAENVFRGDSASNVQQKLATYQEPLSLIGLGIAVLWLLVWIF